MNVATAHASRSAANLASTRKRQPFDFVRERSARRINQHVLCAPVRFDLRTRLDPRSTVSYAHRTLTSSPSPFTSPATRDRPDRVAAHGRPGSRDEPTVRMVALARNRVRCSRIHRRLASDP